MIFSALAPASQVSVAMQCIDVARPSGAPAPLARRLKRGEPAQSRLVGRFAPLQAVMPPEMFAALKPARSSTLAATVER